MNLFKKLTFFAVIVALLCTSIPATQAQDATDGATKVFLPMVNSGAEAEQALVDAAAASLVVKKVISPAQQKAALAFWTHAAIEAAQPMEMVSAGPEEIDLSAPPAATGPRGFVAGGAAAPNADEIARAAYPEDWAALEESAAAMDAETPDGTSEVYTGYTVNQLASMQKIYPHRWLGRISFSAPGGTSYCSGTSISGNVMVTAAHCLYDSETNRWYSNWAFTPAYRNGNAPYGTFPATTCWVLTAWINLNGSYNVNGWAPFDVGVCKMGNNSKGQTMNNAVGWLGREWNASYTRHVHNMGYPFRDYNLSPLPNAGAYLRTCVAETFQQAAEVRGMGCHIASGNSGAAWIVGYAPNVVSGWVTGIHSGGSGGVQTRYGARFNSNNIVPLCNAAGC